jgi:NADH-quinone oxidoreductase subunit K
MSIEIMLSSTGIAFVAASSKWHQPDGQVAVIFIFVTAAAEVAVGLTLLLRISRQWKSVDSDEVSTMKG